MKISWRILSLTILLSLLCGYAWAETIMMGKARPPISPDKVQVYWKAPRKYDVIAIITKGSGSWMFADSSQVDNAIAKIKVEAAKVGANGIILTAIENDSSGGGVSIGVGGFGFPGHHVGVGGDTSVSAPIMHKTVQAEAVYVRR